MLLLPRDITNSSKLLLEREDVNPNHPDENDRNTLGFSGHEVMGGLPLG